MLPWPLPRFTLRLEGSGKIADTRRCMQCLYTYWYHKGYWGVATAAVVDLLNMLIVLAVVLTLTMRFHWDVALHCTEADCAHTALIGGLSWPHLFDRRSVVGCACGVAVLVSTLAATVYEVVRMLETVYVQREVEQLARDAGVDTGYLTPYHRWCAQQLQQERRRRWRGYRRCHDDDDDDTAHAHNGAAASMTRTSLGGYGVKASRQDAHAYNRRRHRNSRRNNGHRRSNDGDNDDVAASAAVAALHSGRQPLLTTMSWGAFLECVCQSAALQHGLKACVDGAPLSVLHAVQAMLRTDNFVVALHDTGVLERGALRYVKVDMVAHLIDAMFDPFGTLHTPSHSVWAVRARVLQYALLYTAGFALVATYAVVELLVRHAAEVRADCCALVQAEWCVRARWCFRLYNEVPHIHACRLAHGRDVARRMVRHLRVSSSVPRLVRRSCSTCVCALVALSFANPPLLLGGRVGGVTLVWWLTLALLLHAAVAEEDVREREYVYTRDLHRLIAAVHYARSEWHESGEACVQSLTRDWLHSRLQLIIDDLARTLCLPLILAAALFDGSVEALTTHVHACAVFVDGVGSVAAGCVFAADCSDNDNGTEASVSDGRRTARDEGWLRVDDVTTLSMTTATMASPAQYAQRVRNSVASFAAVYPQWALQHMCLSQAATTTTATRSEGSVRQGTAHHTRAHSAIVRQSRRRAASGSDSSGSNSSDDSSSGSSDDNSAILHASHADTATLRCFLLDLHTRVTTSGTTATAVAAAVAHAVHADSEVNSDATRVVRNATAAATTTPCNRTHTSDCVQDDKRSSNEDNGSCSDSCSSGDRCSDDGTRNSCNKACTMRRSLQSLRDTTTAHEREQLFVSYVSATPTRTRTH